MITGRPEKPADWHVPAGFELVAAVDPAWEIDLTHRPCRRAFGTGTKACGMPSEAVLLRGRQLWGYCEAHMYGRWIEEGFVMHWILAARNA